jgi:hypothetical protein
MLKKRKNLGKLRLYRLLLRARSTAFKQEQRVCRDLAGSILKLPKRLSSSKTKR